MVGFEWVTVKNKDINEVISLWRLVQAYVKTRELNGGKAAEEIRVSSTLINVWGHLVQAPN